jgi:hypothetical protein
MQNFDHNIGFGEKRQCFRRKSQKIVTSTPGVFFTLSYINGPSLK